MSHTALQFCTEEHLHTHKGAWTYSRKTWSPSNALLGYSQAIAGITSPSGIHWDRLVLKPTTPKNNQLVQTPMSAISAETSTSVFRHENHHRMSWGAVLKKIFHAKRSCCSGVGHIAGCRGKAVWDATGFAGCLGQESMVGKERCSDDFWRNRDEKKREGLRS